MKRYRVESRSKDSHFRVDCTEDKLEYWKHICKYDANAEKGKSFYREYPLKSAKKIYF